MKHNLNAAAQPQPCDGRAMNRAAYNRISPQWERARTAFFGREQAYLDTLLDGLSPRSTILDAGCGTGRPMAEYVIGRGHRIVGLDQSEELLAKARARFPEEQWVHAALETYAFEEPCAAAILWDVLFHIGRAHHAAILERISRCLTSGGRLMLTVGGSAHPAFTDSMFGETFFYDSRPPHEVLHLLRGLGLVPIISEFMNMPTSERDKGRYAIVAEKQ